MFKPKKLGYEIYRHPGFEGLVFRVLQKKWDDKFVKIIKRKSVEHLYLNSTWNSEWEQVDLSFLHDLQGHGLKYLTIIHYGRLNISPIAYLDNLETIVIDCEYSRCPDLSNFKNLKRFNAKYTPSAKSIFDCHWLKNLALFSFPHLDLQALNNFSQLESLTISTRKIESLAGIENLKELRSLDIHYATKLKNLDGIELCQKLKSVVAFRCGNLQGLERFGNLVDTRKGMN